MSRAEAVTVNVAGFGVFATLAVLYGFCETMNGDWSQLDTTSLGVRSSVASLEKDLEQIFVK